MNPIGLHCLHQKDVPEIIRVCDLWQSSVVKFLDGIPELAQVVRGVNHPITGILRLWREGLFSSNDFDPLRQRCTHDGVFDAEEAVRLWLEGYDIGDYQHWLETEVMHWKRCASAETKPNVMVYSEQDLIANLQTAYNELARLAANQALMLKQDKGRRGQDGN